jgi:hypothetical protein
MKLEELNIKKNGNGYQESNVQNLFSAIEHVLYLEGRFYKIKLNDILKTSNELDTSSDNQLAENLEKITSYITTISSSEFQLKNKLKKLKRELLVFTGVSNKYNSNSEWTAKQNLLSNVNTKTEYLQRLEDIDNTETLIEELIDLKWVLKERVKILITLIENRYFIKGGKHHDRSY